jgi:hypothetical protein
VVLVFCEAQFNELPSIEDSNVDDVVFTLNSSSCSAVDEVVRHSGSP